MLKATQIQFLDITNKLNDYNEIYNLNNHLLDTNTVELKNLSNKNDQIKTKVMKFKQQYLLTDYGIHEYTMYNNILAFTITVACFTLVIVAKTEITAYKRLIWICVAIGVFYLIVVMIILRSNINRRKYAWSQWYWSPVASVT